MDETEKLLKRFALKKPVELESCPFCRKKVAEVCTAQSCEECVNFENEELCPAYKPFSEENDDCPYKAVVCVMNKGGCGAASGWRGSVEEAIYAWNNRR